MTGADLLTRMSVMDNELEITSGGADETRALAALDMAQDAFEALAATEARMLGSVSTMTTTASTEATAWPTTLLRLDSLWKLNTDVTPNLPAYEIIQRFDSARPSAPWPLSLANIAGGGAPVEFFTDRANVYWSPLPNATYTVRVYGLHSATNLTTRAITFGFPDMVASPIAGVAVKLLKLGIGDPTDEVSAIAEQFYVPVIKALRKFTRTRPEGRYYSSYHST